MCVNLLLEIAFNAGQCMGKEYKLVSFALVLGSTLLDSGACHAW